jgi:hypothetical protein
MLDNYHELLGILEKIEISKLGEINKALKELDEVADSFLEEYDDDKNGVIDILELIKDENRESLAKNLNEGNSQLNKIVEAMKNLENEITKYRQGTTNKENTEQKAKHKRQQTSNQLQVLTDNQVKEIQTQVEVPPKQN